MRLSRLVDNETTGVVHSFLGICDLSADCVEDSWLLSGTLTDQPINRQYYCWRCVFARLKNRHQRCHVTEEQISHFLSFNKMTQRRTAIRAVTALVSVLYTTLHRSQRRLWLPFKPTFPLFSQVGNKYPERLFSDTVVRAETRYSLQ